MKITSVSIQKETNENSRMIGYAEIVFDNCLKVNGIRIIRGNTRIFAAMPNKKLSDGKYKDYEFISRNSNLTMETFLNHIPAGVGMITFSLDKKKILIQKEFRLACNEWVYNFPAGLIDEDETPEMAATRELKEETGLTIKKIEKVLSPSYASQGTSDEMMTIVICIADGKIENSCYVNEEIEAKWYNLSIIHI